MDTPTPAPTYSQKHPQKTLEARSQTHVWATRTHACTHTRADLAQPRFRHIREGVHNISVMLPVSRNGARTPVHRSSPTSASSCRHLSPRTRQQVCLLRRMRKRARGVKDARQPGSKAYPAFCTRNSSVPRGEECGGLQIVAAYAT
jgi:hypothetical protein